MIKIKHKIIIIAFVVVLFVTSPNAMSITKNNTITASTSYQLLSTFSDPIIEDILEVIDENLIQEYLETLVGYGPRMTGTYGCEKSADYIYQQFDEMGLKTRYHNWSSFGNKFHPRFFESQNVEGVLIGTNPESDKVIIFNAHYDSTANSPGANDDGSGTVAVLAAAFALSQFQFEHTIKFVAFSGEEVGLLGSHIYAKEAYENNDNIIVDLNADMIGYADTFEGGKQMGISATEDAQWMLDICDSISNNYSIDIQINRGQTNREGRGWGDYHSFVEYGYETLSCWESDHDPNMHTPNDNMDNVNISYLVKTTKIITGTLAYLGNSHDFGIQVRIESPKYGKFYFEGMEKRCIADLKTIVLDDIWIWADVKYASVPLVRAEFYLDDQLEFIDTEEPFKWHFNKFSVRKHKITVIVYDQQGRNSTDFRNIRFINLFKNR